MYDIVSKHMFLDGNKRAGFYVALYFLALNDCNLDNIQNNDETVEFFLNITKGELNFEQISDWLKHKVRC